MQHHTENILNEKFNAKLPLNARMFEIKMSEQ